MKEPFCNMSDFGIFNPSSDITRLIKNTEMAQFILVQMNVSIELLKMNFRIQLTDKQQTYQYFQTNISLVASCVKTWLQCSS